MLNTYDVTKFDCLAFVDGSCLRNPGPGGWAALVYQGQVPLLASGYSPQTTNNEMELTALLGALQFLKRQIAPENLAAIRVLFLIDSKYVISGFTEYFPKWEKNGFVTVAGTPPKNLELWKMISETAKGLHLTFRWVPGHEGILGNEVVDAAARFAAENQTPHPTGELPTRAEIEVGIETAAHSKSNDPKLSAPVYLAALDGEIFSFDNWPECEAKVRGRKAHYKKIKTAQERLAFIDAYAKKK